MRKVTQGTYRKDPHYDRVVRAVNEILSSSQVVAPVEVFIRMGLLRREDLENWRFGRIPYLERVIQCNLSKAERILRILRLHAQDRGLKPSDTVYRRWGKGCKQILRFSRFGHPRLEGFYAQHFVKGSGKPAPPAEPTEPAEPPPAPPALQSHASGVRACSTRSPISRISRSSRPIAIA
jgi:hypothetical protein